MKLKQLFAAALMLVSAGAWAQTDVTSTYLTNADFSQTTPLDNGLCGYGKDMGGKGTTYYGLQAIDGWTSTVLSGDNSNSSYPNSGMGGAVFAYGSDHLMMGNNTKAPSVDPDGNAGNCLGFFGVWGCGGYYYQEVTLAAGEYTINIPVYNQSGTQANTSYIGWIPNSGASHTMATNPTVGSWTTLTTSFTLAEATTGKICLGYQSTGSGSGDNAMLYFDKVQILYKAVVVKDVLSTAIAAATYANNTLKSSDLASAIATAQTVYGNTTATQDEVNAAAATLAVATESAMSAAGDVTGIFLSNPGFESCTVTTTNAAAGGSAAPVNIEGDWTQTGSAAWSSSAVVAYGGEGQVNGVSAPSADNAGNSGNALGVSVGWGGTVTYQSAAVKFPAGVYTAKVNAYNALEGVTQFKSMFGFVPTSGTSTLSTKDAFAYGEWVEDKVTFTLNEATEGVIQVGGQAISGGSGANAKVFLDNITITFKSFLDGAKAAWDEAVAAANQAKTDCPNVTGEELTALEAELAKAEPTTVAGYNEATDALTTATNTFTAAKAAYDAYANFLSDYLPENELVYATTEKYTAIGDAYAGEGNVVNAADATARVAAALKALRAYYESHAMAEKVEGAVDMTSKVAAANADTNEGWTNGIGTNQGQGYTDAEGQVSSKYLDGGWASNTGVNIDMTRTVEIPAGKYLLSVTARGAENLDEYTLSIGGETINLPHHGGSGGVFGNGWDDVSVEFVTDGSNQTLEVKATSTASQQWISINRFRLVRLELYTEMAKAADYEALNSAIASAEAKALGFDAGEFAPYENVEVIKAIATAKAIDQAVENAKDDVTALTETLTNGWTANDAEVDAIFDGQFATTAANTTSGDINLPGWTKIQGIRLLVKDETVDPGLAYTDGKAAVFSWGGTTLTYGEQEGYTLPLNKYSIYKLTFKASAWRDGTWPSKVAVTLDGVEQGEATSVPGMINDAEGNPFRTYTYYLEPTADNSVLKIYMNQHFTLADLSLKLAVAEDITISENADYTPAKNYANVTLARAIKADVWNTFVVPFDLSNDELKTAFGDEVAVAEFSDEADGENVQVNFNKMETPAITANKPVLLKGNAGSSFTFNGKVIKEGEAKVAGTYVDFVGSYAAATAVEAGDYFISANKLYKSVGETTLKGTHAYIDATEEATVRMFINDLETAIDAVNVDAPQNGAIFNLAGQRVNKAQKGIYIVNGKKVLVK